MSEALSLKLEILRAVLRANLAGSRVVEVVVDLDVWRRLHAERPQQAGLFERETAEPRRGYLGRTPVRPDAETKGWQVITADQVGVDHDSAAAE